MRILVTGKTGQLGWELRQALAPLGDITAVGTEDVDLLDSEAVRQSIRDVAPNLIVNPAAYTWVDQAEKEPAVARAVNAEAPAIMAEEAKRISAGFVHFSTDYVFDGVKSTPYTEEDEPKPINVYGETKLAGDRAIQASGIPYLILRTSWVYGTRGKNFLLSVLRLASEREELRIVDDQIGAPTWSRMIAQATALILAKVNDQNPPLSSLSKISGIYNVTAGGQTSWYHFARAILENPWAKLLQSEPIVAKRVVPILSKEYPTAARRPAYSVLSNARLGKTFGLNLPSWEDQLKMALDVG